MCKMISPGFFIFYIFLFWAVKEGKREKMTQDEEKRSVAVDISGTIYHILSFMVHWCKMMISLGFFSFYQNFDSFAC